ncbi:12866_t:CDS:2, partial [Cetraspora pellucida]
KQSTISSEIKIPYNQKVEQGLIYKLFIFINKKHLSNSISDRQILENILDENDSTSGSASHLRLNTEVSPNNMTHIFNSSDVDEIGESEDGDFSDDNNEDDDKNYDSFYQKIANNRFKNIVRDHTLEAEQAREAELVSKETPFDLAHSANISTRRRHRNPTLPPTYDGVSSIPSMNRREFTAGQRDRSASPTRRVPSRRDENTNRDNVNNLGGDLGNNVGGNSSHNANDVGRDSGHNANDVGENSGHSVDDTGGDLGENLYDTTYKFSSDLTSITSALNISASQNDSDFSMADAGGDSQLLESINEEGS